MHSLGDFHLQMYAVRKLSSFEAAEQAVSAAEKLELGKRRDEL